MWKAVERHIWFDGLYLHLLELVQYVLRCDFLSIDFIYLGFTGEIATFINWGR